MSLRRWDELVWWGVLLLGRSRGDLWHREASCYHFLMIVTHHLWWCLPWEDHRGGLGFCSKKNIFIVMVYRPLNRGCPNFFQGNVPCVCFREVTSLLQQPPLCQFTVICFILNKIQIILQRIQSKKQKTLWITESCLLLAGEAMGDGVGCKGGNSERLIFHYAPYFPYTATT